MSSLSQEVINDLTTIPEGVEDPYGYILSLMGGEHVFYKFFDLYLYQLGDIDEYSSALFLSRCLAFRLPEGDPSEEVYFKTLLFVNLERNFRDIKPTFSEVFKMTESEFRQLVESRGIGKYKYKYRLDFVAQYVYMSIVIL
jgi:hypothetical protein